MRAGRYTLSHLEDTSLLFTTPSSTFNLPPIHSFPTTSTSPSQPSSTISPSISTSPLTPPTHSTLYLLFLYINIIIKKNLGLQKIKKKINLNYRLARLKFSSNKLCFNFSLIETTLETVLCTSLIRGNRYLLFFSKTAP